MNVKDKTGNASIGVGDLAQSVGRTIGDKSGSRGPVVSGKKDDLRSRTGKASCL